MSEPYPGWSALIEAFGPLAGVALSVLFGVLVMLGRRAIHGRDEE